MAACVTAIAVPEGLDQAAVCDYVRARLRRDDLRQ
jgi:hypothetical protein